MTESASSVDPILQDHAKSNLKIAELKAYALYNNRCVDVIYDGQCLESCPIGTSLEVVMLSNVDLVIRRCQGMEAGIAARLLIFL